MTLFATLALLAFATSAQAATISFSISEDGGPATTFNSGADTSTIGPFTFGDFSVGALSGSTDPFLSLPDLLQANQIDVSTTTAGSHILHLAINAVGLNAPLGLQELNSQFDATGITPGWDVLERTQINGTTIDAAATFLTVGGQSLFNTFNLTPNFTATALIDISTHGIAGGTNTGVTLEVAAVPGPLAGAGIPGLIAAAVGLFGMWRRRSR